MSELIIKNLCVRYGQDEELVLDNININASKGEFILVTGSSGSGKSTLLKALTGIISDKEFVSGQIYYEANDLTNLKTSKRAKFIGSVLQNADEQIIFARVDDELAFPLENLRYQASEIKELLAYWSKFMNLDLNNDTSKLSGGQKQSLISASTLAMGQKVLLLDEPLANLDKHAARELLKLLKELCIKKEYIIIFIEHRIDIVKEFADRIIVIENKKAHEINKKELSINNQSVKFKPLESTIQKDVAISLKNITYEVNKRKIISDFNFDFYKGSKYLISGDNGSGKTTLLNIIAGLIKPTSGKVETSIKISERYKRIGIVMQNPNYQLFMPSVQEELQFQAKSKEFLKELIEILNLSPILLRHPQSLSEGQKRRVGVAAILALEPDILLLDEPSVGQDKVAMDLLIKAIIALNKRKETTIITVSHDGRCDYLLGDNLLKIVDCKLSCGSV